MPTKPSWPDGNTTTSKTRQHDHPPTDGVTTPSGDKIEPNQNSPRFQGKPTRQELEAITDDAEREARVQELTAYLHENSRVLNAAEIFELDDVIDPADTHRTIACTLAAAGPVSPSGRTIDSW